MTCPTRCEKAKQLISIHSRIKYDFIFRFEPYVDRKEGKSHRKNPHRVWSSVGSPNANSQVNGQSSIPFHCVQAQPTCASASSPDPTKIAAKVHVSRNSSRLRAVLAFLRLFFVNFASSCDETDLKLYVGMSYYFGCFPRLRALDITPKKSQKRGQQRTSSLHRIPRLHWLGEKTEQLLLACTDW